MAGETTGLADLLRTGADPRFPDHGWRTALWNGVPEPPGQATFTVNCGMTVSYLKNGLELVLPGPAAAPGLYRLDTMRDLLEVAVSTWSPTWCAVKPQAFWNAAPRGTSIGVFASWVAYLDRTLITDVGDLPAGVRRVDLGDGVVFVMASSPADLTVDLVDPLQRAVELDPSWRLAPVPS